MLLWKCSKLSRWIFLSEKTYACCQNSASPNYKIILFRAIFSISNYLELFNEVSVILNMQKWSNRVVEISSGAKISPHTKYQPCTFKINDFDILGFSILYRPKFFCKNQKMSITKWWWNQKISLHAKNQLSSLKITHFIDVFVSFSDPWKPHNFDPK